MEELIMVPFHPEKLEVGMFLQKIRNGILIPQYTVATESSVQIYPKMGFEWVPVEPYLVSDEEGDVDSLYAFYIGDEWTIAMFDELLGAPIKRVELVTKEPKDLDYEWVKFQLKIK